MEQKQFLPLRPFIEIFRWQSGKSLKLNLVDIHHRFWNMPNASKVQILVWLSVLATFLEFLFRGVFFQFRNIGESKDSLVVA